MADAQAKPAKRVLVVDDTRDCREPLAALLRTEGYEVDCAADGLEGLGKIDTFSPDIVLLDLMMPRMDGFGFLAAVRKEPRWEKLRVIVFTAYGVGIDVHRLDELGVGEFCLKGSAGFQHLLTQIRRPAERMDA